MRPTTTFMVRYAGTMLQLQVYRTNYNDIGKTFKVLIEGDSKRSVNDWMGRSTQNKVVVFPKGGYELKKGDYVNVKVDECTGATLIGKITF